jgi:hypothetical protein
MVSRPGAFVFKGPAFGDELGLGWRWMGVPLEINVFWDPAREDAAGGEWRVWYGGETYWRSTAEFLRGVEISSIRSGRGLTS